MRNHRKSLIVVACAALIFVGSVIGGARLIKPALSQIPGVQVLTSLTGTEYIPNAAATVSQVFSTSTQAGYARSQSLLYTTIASVASTATSSEQTLASYSLPGGTLNIGTKLRIKASFSAGANGDTKTFKCYFGASVMTSGSLTTNNKNGSCEMIVTKTAASAQIAYANMLVDTTPITGYVNLSGTDNDANAITIKFTGTSLATAGDIVMNDFSVERLGQ